MAHINITSYPSAVTGRARDDAHVGIYQAGEQEGGAFVDTVGGIILLTITEHETDGSKHYIIDLSDLSIAEA